MSAQLPFDAEAERAILGAVILRNSALDSAADLVEPEDFYVPRNRSVFQAMLAARDRGLALDAVTLDAELRRSGAHRHDGQCSNGCADMHFLSEAAASTPTAENVAHYCRLVAEAAQVRALMVAAYEVVERAAKWKGDVRQLMDECEARVFCALRERGRTPVIDGHALMTAVTRDMGRRAERPMEVPGVPTGFAEYDKRTGGLHPGELTVIAARPSIGKTSFAVNLALHVAVEAKLPVMVFSLEMSQSAVGERLVCSDARVDTVRSRTGALNADEWGRAFASAGRIAGSAFRLDDNASNTVRQIRARARRFRADRAYFPDGTALGLIVVDYLQLVKLGVRAESRDQEVGEVTLQLKALSKELSLPVVALAQLNRAVEDRQGPPRLSDLRESGAIEQHSDNVAFLHRPKRGSDGFHDGLRTDLILAKQRNGPVATVPLLFMPECARFEAFMDGAPPPSPPPHWQDG